MTKLDFIHQSAIANMAALVADRARHTIGKLNEDALGGLSRLAWEPAVRLAEVIDSTEGFDDSPLSDMKGYDMMSKYCEGELNEKCGVLFAEVGFPNTSRGNLEMIYRSKFGGGRMSFDKFLMLARHLNVISVDTSNHKYICKFNKFNLFCPKID